VWKTCPNFTTPHVLIIQVKNTETMMFHPVTWNMESEIGPNESVSTAVVRAVSTVDGHEPRSLRPLEYVLDTDALNALFESRSTGEPRTGGCLSVVDNGCRVSIDNGEYLTIEPLESSHRASTDGRSRGNGAAD
jgi:hypothetical protein